MLQQIITIILSRICKVQLFFQHVRITPIVHSPSRPIM